MKKFFRLVSMLAVAGLTFAYTSCTDYSEDVNRLDERIDGHVADVNAQIDALKKTDEGLQSSINAANDAIKALQDNTASLKEELTKLSEKHDADIKALAATHAADKAALEKQLADKAAELKTALDNLDAEYTKKFSDLEAAYKQADVELKNQITQNSTKIATLESDVKKINDEVIPAVKKQIEDLAAKADETYATKVELTTKTTEIINLVNTEVAKLTTRLEGVESRLGDLETAHKALKESFDETSAAQDKAIKDLQAKVAALEASKADKTDIVEVKGLVQAAQEAADAAQAAADEAKTAADNAQKTANEAVTAAAAAQTTADNALETAKGALGKVEALIDALGVYAQKGVLEAKIQELVNADIVLAAKDAELVAADAELAKKYKELADKDAEFATMIAGIQTQLAQMGKDMKQQDSILAENIKAAREDADKKVAEAKELALQEIAKLNETLKDEIKGVYNHLEAEDAKLQAQINKLVEEKFNTADFAETFKAAYEARFNDDFAAAWEKTFQPAFDIAFKTAWDNTFQDAFDTAFEIAWDKKFQGAFDDAFGIAIDAAIKDDGVVGEMVIAKVNAAKDELIKKIDGVKKDLQAQLDIVNTKVGDILLVVGKLADRIQSVTFVPEYDDFAATLYYYATPIEGADGKYIPVPISDTKTVVAKFEVYPKSQARNVADMLKPGTTGNGASLVAVPLKGSWTRGAVETPKATIIKSDVEANGVVSIEAVFGADVPFDLPYNLWGAEPEDKNAVSFAIALRVDSPAETVVRDGVTETSGTSVNAGSRIESAYVPVELSDNSFIGGFFLYDFVNEVPFKDDAYHTEEWSKAPAQWNYFAGYDYAVKMFDRTGKKCVKTLEAAAEMMNIDVKAITPKFTVKPDVIKIGGAGSKPVEAPKNAKYFTPKANPKGLIDFATLAECNIAMDDLVRVEPELAVGSQMNHCVVFTIENIGNVCEYDVYYEIIRRQVTFNVKPFEGKNRIDWSYAKAAELTKDKTSGVAYDNPITFVECSVDRIDENDDHKITLGEILELTPTYEVTVNGEKQTLPATTTPIKIGKVAHLVHDVAAVEIPGGAYKFAQGKENDYVVKSVYRVEKNATDYNVIFNYVLGAMPEDPVVKLPNMEIPFESGKAFFEKKYEKEDYMSQPQLAALVPYFKDADQLWASINEMYYKPFATITYYNGKNYGGFTASTNLNITPDGLVVGINRKDLNSFDDKFGFYASRQTWYGVTYKFVNSDLKGISFKKPVFELAPSPEYLNADWTGTILHEAKYDKYVLKQDIDLSKYVTVANYDKKEDKLTITFDQETKADDAKGIINVPVINTTEVAVIPNAAAPAFPTIKSSFINWLTWSTSDKRGTSFTAREDKINAVLKLDGIYLDDATIILSTPRPITKFAFDEFVQTIPEGSTSTTVKLWNKMIIEGVLEEGNIAKQDATTLTGAIYGTVKGKKSNPNTYDCVVSFPSADNVRVYVGGVLQPVYNLEKFTYDAAKGEITFTGDLADLVQPVKFEFDATLNYVLDRVHKDQLPATASVTFQK